MGRKKLILIFCILIIGGLIMYKSLQPQQTQALLDTDKEVFEILLQGILVNPIRTQYNGNYKVLRKTGNESLYDVSFEKKQVLIDSYEDNETKEIIYIYRQDTIICLEAGWDEKEIVTYLDEEQKKIDKNYTYLVPSTLSFYKTGLLSKEVDLNRNLIKASGISASFEEGDIYKFCYQANPEEDYHLKFGDNSVIVIQGKDIVGDSLFTNVTAESGDANFTHLNISTTAPYDSLVGYWSFDGDKENTEGTTAYDFTKNNWDGTMVANAVASSNNCMGDFGNCLQLDNTGDYIGGTGSESINFTLSAWVSVAATVTNYDGIVAYTDSSQERREIFLGTTGIPSMTWYVDGDGAYFAQSTGSDIDGNDDWHHIAGTYNGTTPLLYVDGVLQSLGGATGAGTNTANILRIGRLGYDSATYGFNGQIDEVMIFNTALTAQQITDIYNNQSARFVRDGTQKVRAVNITDTSTWQDAGYNRVNLTTTYETNMQSNISARIGQFNISVDPDGLVGYWPFEWGSAVDISGEGNDGTITNAVFNETGGLNDTGGFEFDGDGDYVDAGKMASIEGVSEITFVAWVRLDVTPSAQMTVLAKREAAGFMNVLYVDSNPQLNFYVDSATGGGQGIAAPWPDDKQWHHVAGTYNGSLVSVYLDGVIGGTTGALTGLTRVIDGNLEIGSRRSSRYWNGTIDDVLIFNRSLSAAEISTLYNETSAKHNIAYYTDYQNLLGTYNVFNISKEADFIFPDFNFLAGNLTNPFYTPLLLGDITLETWEFEEAPADTEYPLFSSYWDNNASLIDTGIGYFNVTVINTNSTVILHIDNNDIIAHNSSGDVYNTSYTFSSAGTYEYNFSSYGNGTLHLLNFSDNRYYTVNSSDTCTAPASGHWSIDCSDNCVWTSNQNVPANISMLGSGSVTLMSGVNFSFAVKPYYVYAGSGCTLVNNGGNFV